MDNIIILGPKKAGKTTYLMGLALYFDKTDTEYDIKVEPYSNHAKDLKKDAQSVLGSIDPVETEVTEPPINTKVEERIEESEPSLFPPPKLPVHQSPPQEKPQLNYVLPPAQKLSETDSESEKLADDDYLNELDDEEDLNELDDEPVHLLREKVESENQNENETKENETNGSFQKQEMESEYIRVSDSFQVTSNQKSETIKYNMPDYQFRIDIPGELLKQEDKEEIYIRVQDYAGEIFDDLENFESWKKEFEVDKINFNDIGKDPSYLELRKKLDKYNKKSSNKDNKKIEKLQKLIAFINYLAKFSETKKWLLLLTDWDPITFDEAKLPMDDRYIKIFETLLRIIDRSDFRLAVVMGKCERGELWTGRKDPAFDIFKKRLPKTYKHLNRFFGNRNNLEFFACSSFGVLKNLENPKIPLPLPNRKNFIKDDYRRAVIREPKQWKPYGLITPLVWLNTEKVWKHIDL